MTEKEFISKFNIRILSNLFQLRHKINFYDSKEQVESKKRLPKLFVQSQEELAEIEKILIQ